jgi:hypothetical protein
VRLAECLEEVLESRVEGVNAGATGWGPDQACLRLEAEIDELDADLVVLVLCANNDLGDLMRNKLFRLDAEGRLERGHPTLDPALIEQQAQHRRRASSLALGRAWGELLRMRSFGPPESTSDQQLDLQVLAYLRALRDEYADCATRRSTLVHNLFQDVYEADVAVEPDSESARGKLRLMTSVLARFEQACTARGLPLFALVVPSAVDLAPDFGIRVDPVLYPRYDPRRLSDSLAACLVQAGIPYLDFFDDFKRSSPAQLFIGGLDFHWNARGIALGAELAASGILQAGLLAP